MKKLIILSYTIVGAVLLGCMTKTNQELSSKKPLREVNLEYLMQSVLWQQLSGEYRALSHQAFNLAKIQLDQSLANGNEIDKPLAIITDIDETVLDNSPFIAKLIELGEPYSESRWIQWGRLQRANAVPGAVNFLNYAHSKGVEIFYLSNRFSNQLGETVKNLQEAGFPNVKEDHIFLRKDKRGKEARRAKINRSHDIVMLLGDNLEDFSPVFEHPHGPTTNQLVDSLSLNFGSKFIVLPNPIYGDWEAKALYGNNFEWTEVQRDSIRKIKLTAY